MYFFVNGRENNIKKLVLFIWLTRTKRNQKNKKRKRGGITSKYPSYRQRKRFMGTEGTRATIFVHQKTMGGSSPKGLHTSPSHPNKRHSVKSRASPYGQPH